MYIRYSFYTFILYIHFFNVCSQMDSQNKIQKYCNFLSYKMIKHPASTDLVGVV